MFAFHTNSVQASETSPKKFQFSHTLPVVPTLLLLKANAHKTAMTCTISRPQWRAPTLLYLQRLFLAFDPPKVLT